MTPDMVNGLFELMGAFLVSNHCRVVLRDRSVKGVSIFSTAVFTIWGLWNIVFYGGLDLYFSFYGSLLLMCVNTTYVILMLYFRSKEWRVST